MSGLISDSPQRNGTPVDGNGPDDADRPYTVVVDAEWNGIRLLSCREDIRRETAWSINAREHTLIVHLGGTMRELETEIEGAGATHDSPSPGDFWLVPAGTRYASRARGQFISYAEVKISPDVRVDLPGGDRCLDVLTPRSGDRDEFLYQWIVQLARLAAEPDDVSAMMCDRLQHVLRQHLFRHFRTTRGPRPSARRRPSLSADAARRVADYIRDTLGGQIALRDLAAVAGLTVHQLLIAFRASFGTTPAQYVLVERLRRGRWLLLNTGRDIASIASETGFASHSHFSAAFRRRAGISPREFRECRHLAPMDVAAGRPFPWPV